MDREQIEQRIATLKQSRENLAVQGQKAQAIVDDCRARIEQHNGAILELERLLNQEAAAAAPAPSAADNHQLAYVPVARR